MSIDMERFGSKEQQTDFRDSVHGARTACPYRLQCRACGFEPEDVIVASPRCPKCDGSSWERFVYPRSLLTGPSRRIYERPTRARPSVDRLLGKHMSGVALQAASIGSPS
jgi:hypothetical protein